MSDNATRRLALSSRLWRFLLVVVTAGVTLAMVLLVAGCGGGSATTTGAGGDATTAATTSATTGVTTASGEAADIVVVGIVSDPYQSLDPASDNSDPVMTWNVYESLLRYDLTQKKPVGWLAESWETTDNKTWTFHLRKGVKFQDGTDVDANAVKVSIEHQTTGANGFLLTDLEKVETPDSSTVAITWKYAAPLELMFTSNLYLSVVSPAALEKYGDKAFEPGNMAGTGPYMLKTATQTEVTLERNPSYWGGWEGDHAKAPKLGVIRVIGEAAARVQNLEAGQIQIDRRPPVEEVQRLKAEGFVEYKTATWAKLFMVLNSKSGPTADPKVREAMIAAFPYKDINDIVFQGYGTQCSGLIYPGVFGYDEQKAWSTPRTQDMAKAKAALAASTYPNGCTVEYPSWAGANDPRQVGELWQASLKEIGIELKVAETAGGVVYQTAQSENSPYGAIMINQTMIAPMAPSEYLSMVLSTVPVSQSLAWTYYSNPTVDKDITDAFSLASSDPKSMLEKLKAVDKTLDENNLFIWISDTENRPMASPKLHGFDGMPGPRNGTVDFYNVWLEK